jgi:hypothetical protein
MEARPVYVLFFLISYKFSTLCFLVIMAEKEQSAVGWTSTGYRTTISPLTALKHSSRLDVNLCSV